MSHHDLRFAVVGCGRFGMQLGGILRHQVTGAQVTAVVEPDPSRRERAAGEFCVPAFSTLEQLLEEDSGTFDAVLITSLNCQHRDHSIAAARAGKHIFCEKPMALSGEDCRQMVVAAQENGVRLMVGHKRRLRKAWQRLLEIVQENELGIVNAVNINGWHHHPDIPPWWLSRETGGGLLHRAGVHDIDFMNAVLGQPLWVQATAAPNVRADAQFSETLWLTIGYQGGAVGGLQVSLWFRPTQFRDSFSVQVLGSRGSALLKSSLNSGVNLTWHSAANAAQELICEDGYAEAYVVELNSFIGWITRGETPVLTWREGWKCVSVMEAAYASSANDGQRVPVNLNDLMLRHNAARII